MKANFFLTQTAKFDKNINLFCLVFKTRGFFVRSICLTIGTIGFDCFFYEIKSDNVTYDWAIFSKNICFIAFDFIVLCHLNPNLNNLVETLFTRIFSVLCLMHLNISLIVLRISKSSLSGFIPKNFQPSPCSIDFCLFILSSILPSLCPFSSISLASLQSWKYKSIL